MKDRSLYLSMLIIAVAVMACIGFEMIQNFEMYGGISFLIVAPWLCVIVTVVDVLIRHIEPKKGGRK